MMFATLKGPELFKNFGGNSDEADSLQAAFAVFGASLKNKESFQAWKDLDDSLKYQFIDNIYFLQVDSTVTRRSFPTFKLLQFMVEASVRLSQPEFIVYALQSAQTNNCNIGFVQGLINNFFKDLDRRRLLSIYKLRDAFVQAEQLLSSITQQNYIERNQRQAYWNYTGLAAYLSSQASGAFPTNWVAFTAIKNAFLNHEFDTESVQWALLGYSAILGDGKFPEAISENPTVVEALNVYINAINSDSRKRQSEDSEDFEESAGSRASENRFGSQEQVPPIVTGTRITRPQLSVVIQGMYITECEGYIPRSALDFAIEGMPRDNISYKFRKWLTNVALTSDYQKMPLETMIVLARGVSKFIACRRFARVHINVFTNLAVRQDLIRNHKDHLRILGAICPIIKYLNHRESNVEGEQAEGSNLNISEEEMKLLYDFCDNLVEQIQKEEANLSLEENMKAIKYLVRRLNRFSPEQIKSTKLHKRGFELLEKRTQITSEASTVFGALLNYDLLNDKEMQNILLMALSKAEFRAKENEPEREVFNRRYFSVTQIYNLFSEKKDELVGNQKVVFEKLTDYQERLRPLKAKNQVDGSSQE
jgi:hypothetical protein